MKSYKYVLLLFVLSSALNVGYGLRCYSCNMDFQHGSCIDRYKRIVTCGSHGNEPPSDYSCIVGTYDDTLKGSYLFMGCQSSQNIVKDIRMFDKRTCNTDLCNGGLNYPSNLPQDPVYKNVVTEGSLKCHSCNTDVDEFSDYRRCEPEIVTCGSGNSGTSSEYTCVSGAVWTFKEDLITFMGCQNSASERKERYMQYCIEDLCNNREIFPKEKPERPRLDSTARIGSDLIVVFITALTLLLTAIWF